MPHYVTVGKASEVGPGERAVYEVEEDYIAVFNVGGTYYAVEDRCTHDDGPLAEGEVVGLEIECPRHGARFDLRSGKVTRLPAVSPIRWFPVRVENGDLQIGFTD